MKILGVKDLETFLRKQPGMTIRPSGGNGIIIQGTFRLNHATVYQDREVKIQDEYELEIHILEKEIPRVYEQGGKITQDTSGGHVYLHDQQSRGSWLCLGVPLELWKIFNDSADFNEFSEKCIAPYLFAMSHRRENNGELIFGERAHGSKGIIDHMREESQLSCMNEEQIKKVFYLLSLSKNQAKAERCPYGCGKKLRYCSFRIKLGELRRKYPNREMCRESYRHIAQSRQSKRTDKI